MDFDRDNVLQKVSRLMDMYTQGVLGGEIMPEDANPGLDKNSAENYAYFTLPMALNYQRNSYTLWKSALQSYLDPATRDIFSPPIVKPLFLAEHKKQFPYLSGTKISNYWLYVMQSYTGLSFVDRENISVAPDAHVIQASVRLGLIS